MTPSQAYRAGLEAAAKVAYYAAGNTHVCSACRLALSDEIVFAIRALPVPEDAGSFHITQKANPTADIIARGMKELEDVGETKDFEIEIKSFGLKE